MTNPIAHPTWPDISALITDHDVTEMKQQGLDLRSYDQVSALGHKIYYYLGYKLMPLGNPWPDNWIITYNNWLIDGMPKDAAHRIQIASERKAKSKEASTRVRKDVSQLNKTEKIKIKAAFKGLMDRDPKNASEYDPNALCYFTLAAKHWFPVPTFCQHHIFGFLPWHRWQMLDFENALRSVPGCEDVTLPYWNIETGEFPEIFSEEPFNTYKFPIDVYPDFYTPQTNVGKAGTSIQRNKAFQYSAQVNSSIRNAQTAPKFALYNGITDYTYDSSHHIMRAHDIGHVGCGKTMANQDIAAYDPIFWFFHCNWDRLWWNWQTARGATNLADFQKTLEADDDQRWLIDPEMSISDPFNQTNSDSIDITKIGFSYAEAGPAKPLSSMKKLIAVGPSWRDMNTGQSLTSSFKITKANLDRVSLRVKGVNRIKILGSFYVVLYIGGEEVGRDAFFQSTFSGNCENCVSQSRMNFDFIFDQSHLRDNKGNPQNIEVKVINAITDEELPFDAIGNPTINIRMIH